MKIIAIGAVGFEVLLAIIVTILFLANPTNSIIAMSMVLTYISAGSVVGMVISAWMLSR